MAELKKLGEAAELHVFSKEESAFYVRQRSQEGEASSELMGLISRFILGFDVRYGAIVDTVFFMLR